MKQLIQNYKTGELKLEEVPAPLVRLGGVLVRTANSVVSIGTEKLMMEFARKSLLGKALARPDLAKQVIDLAK
ncbi:MAG: oxidoreductase, partial [Chloroflexi bacterium]|nr:oxidoreductase [Chloroflexota bacterium]